MKHLLLLLLVSTISIFGFSQNNSTHTAGIKRVRVIITDPDNRSIAAASDFFDAPIAKKVLTQISEKEFQNVKKYCNEKDYPTCIRKVMEHNYDDPNSDAKTNKLIGSLTLYRIARFDNIRNKVNYGEYSILVAPAAENKTVIDGCSFEKDFYFLIPTESVKQLNK